MNPSIHDMLPPQATASLIRSGGSPTSLFPQDPLSQGQTPGSAGYDPTLAQQPPIGSQQMQPPTPPMTAGGQTAQTPQMSESQLILQALMDRLSHGSKITEKTTNAIISQIEANQAVTQPQTPNEPNQ